MGLPVLVSRNGKLVPPAQANVSVFDPALYGAFGVYESLQVVNGCVFAQGPHLDRLIQSATTLSITLPTSRSDFEGWIGHVLTANQARDCVLRILMLGADNGGETVAFIWPQQAPVYAPELYRLGVAAITFAGERALPTCKSLNTLVSSLARRRAAESGAHEALLHHDEQLTEGSNSNLFAVVEREVITPPADQVLPGVTRDLVMKLARQQGIPLREGALPVAGLVEWDECFITSTSRHVLPVTTIDGRPVGTGRPGPMTEQLSALFEGYFESHTACRA